MHGLDSSGSGCHPMVSSCEHINEPSISILRSILIFSYLFIFLTRGLFPSGFPTEIFRIIFIYACCMSRQSEPY
jgi:hypothetical protein